ncbi:methyltransferase domain-containing protein [Mycobacterium hubeiense]|uniref:methyltransferase domain-containing protein n=1 Tax=Mycobacterium hubeiense TaxID=1867256 RepID=UPI000C7EAC27|nr:methyltransferase domain-containing protein [Mycobacterium sp. QGD 101]
MDRNTYREQSRRTWGEMASGWEDRRAWLMRTTQPVSDWLLENLDPQLGQTVLEIACGTGDLGFLVAERLGADGRLVSTDFAAEMVDVARRQSESRGLTNVEHRVLDAERMDLGDDSVDGVLCRFGYMLMADPAAALRETSRVLRDGGRLAFAVWRSPEKNPWSSLPGMTLVQRGHMPVPGPDAPGIFAMADPDRIHEMVTGAGFSEPEVAEIAFDFTFQDFDDMWDMLVRLTGPLADVLNALPEDERAATRDAIQANVASYRSNDGSYCFPASAWCVLAQ